MLKENKLASILLIVTLVIVGVLGFFGWKKRGEYKDSMSQFESNNGELSRLQSSQPFPNPANVTKKKEAVKQLQGKSDALQNALISYRPESFDDGQILSPADFSKNRQDKTEEVQLLFKEKGVAFPEEFCLGFLSYTTRSPREDATKLLNYQLEANSEFFKTLAHSNISSLLNVYRVEVNPERGAPFREAPRRGRPAAFHPYEVLPMEVTFQANEASLEAFLNSLTNHKDYFFVIRNMRVLNQKQVPPREEDAVFETPVAAPPPPAAAFAEAFGSFTDPDEPAEAEPEEAPAPALAMNDDSNLILKPVLGEEELYVFLRVDLILFNKSPDAQAKN